MLDNTPNQPSKFRTRNWIEINDESHGEYNTDSQIRFKTSVLRLNLFDYSDAYILVSGTIAVTGAGADNVAKRLDERYKGIISKNCAPFIDYASEINNTQIDYVKDKDALILMYNLME